MIHIWNITIIIQKRTKDLSALYQDWKRDQYIQDVEAKRDQMVYESGYYLR